MSEVIRKLQTLNNIYNERKGRDLTFLETLVSEQFLRVVAEFNDLKYEYGFVFNKILEGMGVRLDEDMVYLYNILVDDILHGGD